MTHRRTNHISRLFLWLEYPFQVNLKKYVINSNTDSMEKTYHAIFLSLISENCHWQFARLNTMHTIQGSR